MARYISCASQLSLTNAQFTFFRATLDGECLLSVNRVETSVSQPRISLELEKQWEEGGRNTYLGSVYYVATSSSLNRHHTSNLPSVVMFFLRSNLAGRRCHGVTTTPLSRPRRITHLLYATLEDHYKQINRWILHCLDCLNGSNPLGRYLQSRAMMGVMRACFVQLVQHCHAFSLTASTAKISPVCFHL